MSRCDCCNVILTPQESTRKFKDSGTYTNTCNSCLKDIPVETVEGTYYEEERLGRRDTLEDYADEILYDNEDFEVDDDYLDEI